MSDNIPFEIQTEIIKRLPVKSLIQFRSVCKAWKSLIDSADFINHYRCRQQHMLVSYHYSQDSRKYLSIVDDHTFPEQKVSLIVPLLVTMLERSRIIGCSHGLLCLVSCYYQGMDVPVGDVDDDDDADDDDDDVSIGKAVIWNPSIRKAVAVNVPNVAFGRYRTVLGFGVCSQTNDPKIVKIAYNATSYAIESTSVIPWHVEVFTLGTGAWRASNSMNLPRTSLKFDDTLSGVSLDGAFCWLATDSITMEGEIMSTNLIISFDITSEEFREINLPEALAHYQGLSMTKLRNSLVVIQGRLSNDQVFHVWMMEDGVSKLFTKKFSICTPGSVILAVLEFRKCGEPVLEILDKSCDPYVDDSSLVVYEPYSNHITNLGINGVCSFFLSSYMGSCLGMSGMCSFTLHSYMETLLLFDQLDPTAYDV